ncbi:hypothetical protein [Pseudomonas sp. MWU13-2105]|uniref:hypothetical protein n=1 Tax=Pseudomonas sp. MWU13-2105 TaxID=2935074 RepID=UPI00200F4769|nr:hypothetical protein [Pseudomonas sp. MWU13-2105]
MNLMELNISESSDWYLFERIAQTLEQGLNGTWARKLDGLDQRYWDLLVDDQIITLHLEHYLGISLLVSCDDQNPSANLGARAYSLLDADIADKFRQDWTLGISG